MTEGEKRRAKQYRESHRAELRERQRQFRAIHKDELNRRRREITASGLRPNWRKPRAEATAYNRIYRSKNLLKCRQTYYKCHLRRLYNLDIEDVYKMLEQQNNTCAICDTKIELMKGRKHMDSACVDHDHKTNKVRALLCGRCNMVLGFNNDDITLLEKQIEYLKAHKA